MGDKNDISKILDDTGEPHKDVDKKDVQGIIRNLESLDLENTSSQGTSASTRTVVDRTKWTTEDRMAIIDEAVKQQKTIDLARTHFVSVENVNDRNLECSTHTKNAIWECLFKKNKKDPITIVRLCFLCVPIYSLAQENWSEHMKTVIPIMRRNHMKKIYKTSYEDDIVNVHWEDKQCLRIAFGFEPLEIDHPANNEIVLMAMHDQLAENLSKDKGVIPFLDKHRSGSSFKSWVARKFDGNSESDRMNLAVGVIMNRLDHLQQELPDEAHCRAREFWEHASKNLTAEAADVIVFTEAIVFPGENPPVEIEMIEYLGVARMEYLETGSFTTGSFTKNHIIDLF